MGLLDKIKGALGAKPEPPKPAGRGSRGRGGSGGGQGRSGQGNRSGGQGNRSGQGRGGQGGQGNRQQGGGGGEGTATRSRNRRGGRGRGGSGGGGGGGGAQATSEETTQGSSGQRTRSRGGRGRSGSSGRVTRSGEGSTSRTEGEGGGSTRSRSGGQRSRSGSGGGAAGSARGSRSRSRRGGRSRDRVRRGSSSSGSLRRVLDANERPAVPVKKQILINASDPNEIRVAIREQERVVEVYVERKDHRSLAGNIYKGRVQNVLPGMEAAFVDIGLDRNGFLYVDEVTPAAADSDQAMPVKVATGGDPEDLGETEDVGAIASAISEDGATLDISAVTEDPEPVAEAETDAEAEGEPNDGDPAAANAEPVADEAAAAAKPEAIAGEGAVKNAGKGPRRGKAGQKKKIQELLKPGQEILVQVVKDPMGTKGSRLTTQYSLAGRYLVYVPDGEGLGVSRRLLDAERERLRDIVKEFELPQGGGLIVRTAAEGALDEDIAKDLQLLLALHEKLMEQHGDQRAPKLLYNEADLSLRIIRDLFNDEVEGVIVDDPRQYQRIISYLKRTSPGLTERVTLHEGKRPLFEEFEVEEAIRSTLNKRVNLPSGGYLIIDYAEAFTVVDINTGKAVGKTSLEDTITKTNMEAAEEIVRQLRLRDIGGIVVLDFIDMNLMKNRDAVLEHFRKELSKDRTKTYLVEISPLGLIEMTRQNVSEGVREMLTSTCRTCEGRGVTVSAETYAIDVERAIVEAAEVMGEGVAAVAVELAPAVANILGGTQGKIDEVSQRAGKRVRVFGDPELEQNAFVVKAAGTVDEIDALPVPLRRGEQIKLTVERVDPLSDNDGVAIVDGTIVVVLGAGAEVGQERTVLIVAAEGDRAFATLVKPARRRRRRGGRGRGRSRTAADGTTIDATTDTEADADELSDEEFDESEELEDDLDADEDLDVAAEASDEDEDSEIPERRLNLDDSEDDDAAEEDDQDEDEDEDEDEDDDDDLDDEDDDEDDDDEDSDEPDDEDSDDPDVDDVEPDEPTDEDEEEDDDLDGPEESTEATSARAASRPAGSGQPRRRGSRGGRNRKPAGAKATSDDASGATDGADGEDGES